MANVKRATSALPILRLAAIWAVLLSIVPACVNMDPLEVRYLITSGSSPEGTGSYCPTPIRYEPDSLLLHFIDVGQGDAIWIQTPDDGISGNGERDGFNILIDTGEAGKGELIADYMDSHGFRSGDVIDYLIITHAHFDHYGGAVEILDNFIVRNIIDPGFTNTENITYLQYLDAAEVEVASNGGQFYRPAIGTLFSERYEVRHLFGSEITLTLLNSGAELRLGDQRSNQINNTSIAIAMEYASIPILLMGDAESLVEAEITRALPDLRATIVKVGHHGSATSSSREFLEHIFDNTPEYLRYAVVQSGTRLYSGTMLPHPTTVSRLLEFIPEENYFTTNNGDSPDDDWSAAGDDHIQALIGPDGFVTVCYIP